jgi:hypothetical protein
MKRPRTTTEAWKQVGSVLVPARFPEKAGLGCPKCDDSELVPFAEIQASSHPTIVRFVKRHEACGALQTLEVHGGRVEVTGELRAPD